MRIGPVPVMEPANVLAADWFTVSPPPPPPSARTPPPVPESWLMVKFVAKFPKSSVPPLIV